jgi:RHS repeat-associated protein
MAGISSKAAGKLENKNEKFQGQPFDNELGLDWYGFKWRNHDPQIGRFIQIDPLSEEYVHNSTYAFSENKVTSHFELEGLEAVDMNSGLNQFMAYKYGGKEVGQAYQQGQVAGAKGTIAGVGLFLAFVFPGAASQILAAEIFGVPSPSAPTSVAPTVIAETRAVTAASTEAPAVVSLETRSKEIHAALKPATQSRTTTAVATATTADGKTVTLVGSSEKNLRPAQRGALQPGEVAVSGPGHAEQTVINYASANGMQVTSVAASRPICPTCAAAINNSGANPASPLKAVSSSTYVKPPLLPDLPLPRQP